MDTLKSMKVFAIRAGRLEEVLKEYACQPLGIYAVFPSRKHLPAKTRAFVDFLVEHLAYAQGPSVTPNAKRPTSSRN